MVPPAGLHPHGPGSAILPQAICARGRPDHFPCRRWGVSGTDRGPDARRTSTRAEKWRHIAVDHAYGAVFHLSDQDRRGRGACVVSPTARSAADVRILGGAGGPTSPRRAFFRWQDARRAFTRGGENRSEVAGGRVRASIWHPVLVVGLTLRSGRARDIRS